MILFIHCRVFNVFLASEAQQKKAVVYLFI